jgi:hypothetical protein
VHTLAVLFFFSAADGERKEEEREREEKEKKSVGFYESHHGSTTTKMPKPIYEFKIHHGSYPVGNPSEGNPIVNPLSLLLCRYPLGSNLSNPNFAIIYSRGFGDEGHIDPLHGILTAGSNAPISRPAKKGAQTFWMKTYSENKGLLELLETAGILTRTGQTHSQGFVKLVAVETVLVEGQWAEVCHNQNCERREQLDEGKPRMKKCAKCKEAYYCDSACQKDHWPMHKSRCGTLKEAREGREAIGGDDV